MCPDHPANLIFLERGSPTPSDAPTAHDLARALADQIRPGAAPRDVTVMFGVRRAAAAAYRDRSCGGPVTVLAQALHAQLFGLPTDDEPLPAALDALLQATHAAAAPEQHSAILLQLAEQMRNGAEIIKRYQYLAQWDRLPGDLAGKLRDAHVQALQIAKTLDLVAPALSTAAPAPAGPQPHPVRQPGTSAPAPPAPMTGKTRRSPHR